MCQINLLSQPAQIQDSPAVFPSKSLPLRRFFEVGCFEIYLLRSSIAFLVLPARSLTQTEQHEISKIAKAFSARQLGRSAQLVSD
jgi:hypothetical protein